MVEISKNKMSISMPTQKALFMASGARCAICDCTLYFRKGDASIGILAEQAHIRGERKGSARYDATMTDEERQSYDNLLIVCNNCHKKIDSDETKYTVDNLLKIKQEHEAKVQLLIKKSINDVTCEELAITIKYLTSNTVANNNIDDYTLIHPKEKILKNSLSRNVANFITIGLANFLLVKNYINNQANIDFSFEQNLKNAFICKYKELKEKQLDNNEIFGEIWEFAKANRNTNESVAAALSIISYFFLECDIFEK